MRLRIVAITLSLSTSALSGLGAQAARVGRLPVLAKPPASGGTCRRDSTNAQLRGAGVVRLIGFTMEDSSSHRLQSIGVDRYGAPVMLMATMGTRQARRGESETVTVFFGVNGGVIRGERMAFTTGVPTHLSDDRAGVALFAADTAAAVSLAKALLLRCDK